MPTSWSRGTRFALELALATDRARCAFDARIASEEARRTLARQTTTRRRSATLAMARATATARATVTRNGAPRVVARARATARAGAVTRRANDARAARAATLRTRARRERTRARASDARVDESDDSFASASLSAAIAQRALMMIESNAVVGLSRGEHASELARRLAEALESGALENVKVVALEPLAAKECAVNGLEMRSIDEVRAIDVTFAQPSECAVVVTNGQKSIASVFGRETTPVQPDIERAKAAMKKSVKVVLLKELFVDKIGGSIPVVVEAENWEEHAEELDDLFLGDAEVWRRGATFDANPRGGKNPYVSADGSHTLLDLRFEDPINSGRWECGLMLDGKPCGPYELQYALENDVEGVLAHGIYTQADVVITLNPDTLEAVTIERD